MASVWKNKTSKTLGPMNQQNVFKTPPNVNSYSKAAAKTKKASTPGPMNQVNIPVPKPKTNTAAKTTSAANTSMFGTTGFGDIDFNQYRAQSATVADLAKKYGLDYSREYAKRQAEAEAQAKRSGLEAQRDQINEGVRNAQDALSRDYFQKGLMSAQSQVDGGINAGLANEANLRLSMNRQAEMGDIMGQANLAQNEVSRGLTDVETARVAAEEKLYNERLQQAVEILQRDKSLDMEEKQYLLNAMLQQRSQNIGMDQFNRQLDWDKYQFNNMSATDKSRLDWDKYMFNNMSATDKAGLDWDKYMFNNMSAYQQAGLDWEKYQFNNMSAADQDASKLAWARLEEEKSQFKSEMEWRKYEFNNMSASEKAQFNENKRQFGEEMAWRMYELEYTSEMALQEAQAGLGGGTYGGALDFLP